MFPRLLESRNSLDSLEEHTTYTLVRLEADPSASDLAPPFTERELTRAGTRAQARADQVAEESATLIAAFSLDLLKIVGGDRDDKRWSHLFSERPPVLARRGLERQIDVVRSWPAYLASEPSLAVWAEPFTRVVDKGTVAVSQRDLAASTRSTWRALERETLFRDANPLFTFTDHNRWPPRGPVNAVLSYLYTMLYGHTLQACEAASLDPYRGFPHGPGIGRASLSLEGERKGRPSPGGVSDKARTPDRDAGLQPPHPRAPRTIP